MKATVKNAGFALLLAAGAIFAAGPVLADKPSWAGKGKGNDDRGDKGGQHEGKRKHFKDHDREYVRDYYAGEYSRKGKCPPGLAKKNNGCMCRRSRSTCSRSKSSPKRRLRNGMKTRSLRSPALLIRIASSSALNSMTS